MEEEEQKYLVWHSTNTGVLFTNILSFKYKNSSSLTALPQEVRVYLANQSSYLSSTLKSGRFTDDVSSPTLT
ncbi:hypothetical protein J6590_085248 [Homalodisca vitripennis]|nr:hypothetical protein J6590_085248 [Homalodisca vitripennis]